MSLSLGEVAASRTLDVINRKVKRSICRYEGAIPPKLAIDGKLFLPALDHRKRNGKLPLVTVVPGTRGVAPSHLKHAETVVTDGFAAFVLDCFGARDVTSTVANQTQFSFAASAYDVLATWQVLAENTHRGFVLIQSPYSVELLPCSLRRAIS
jgi:hypothetical protein